MVIMYDNKYDELIATAISELRATTNISQLAPGAKARALLEITMRELGTMYNTFSTDMLQAFVKYATGEHLDLIAELVGLTRLQANRNAAPANVKTQKFYVESGTFGNINDGTFTIPVGTLIRTATDVAGAAPIYYRVSEACVCTSTLSEVYASVQALEFGQIANVGEGTLVLHNFEIYDDYLNNTLKTTNIESIAYAAEVETDAGLRYRISNKVLGGEGANEASIRMAALSVPGVADVALDEFTYGIGTGSVYIKAITPTVSQTLINTVNEALALKKAYGNLVEARTPKVVGVEMELTLNLYKPISLDRSTDLRKRVKDNITMYINRLDISESLQLDLLLREILSVDSNIRSIGTPAQPLNALYAWRYSAADDNRVPSKILAGQGITAQSFERIVIEPTPPTQGTDRIIVRII